MTGKLYTKGALDLIRERRERVEQETRLSDWARDPFAHLDAGHVTILDLETLDDVVFDPYDHQRQIVREWLDLERLAKTGELRFENAHEEKSRQMGVTWILAWCALWVVKYHAAPGIVLHLNATEVDDGGRASTPDSFFGKIRFMEGRMPEEHKTPLRFARSPSSSRIINQARPNAYIVGESATPDPGRGGRYAWGIIDEAARIPFGESAHKALSRAIPKGRLYNSTPYGEDNVYFRLRRDRPRGYRFMRHHWSLHPVYGAGQHIAAALDDRRDVVVDAARGCDQCKHTLAGVKWTAQDPVSHRYPGQLTSPWYEEAILEMTDEDVAQELDIDYEASLPARVYGEFTSEMHVVEDGIDFDPAFGYELAFDYGLDTTSVIILQDAPDSLRAIGEVEIVGDAIPDVVVPQLVEELKDIGVSEERLARKWTLQVLAVGDPAGEGRELSTGKPLVSHYKRLGWGIVAPKRYTVARTVVAVKRVLMGKPKPLRVCAIGCPELIRHMKSNRWPTDRHGKRVITAKQPLDDEHNHMARALAYYVTYKYPPPPIGEMIDDQLRKATERVARGGKLSDISYGMKL